MPAHPGALARLTAIPDLHVSETIPLSRHTRFGIGGPADIYAYTAREESFIAALRVAQSSDLPYVVIGDGTNLIVSDAGFRGLVLRFTAGAISHAGMAVHAEAGAELQDLVDYSIAHGLKGLETMTGIPGSVGAAVYGNAGAYGHSIMERVHHVRFFDGAAIRTCSHAECEFHYRESAFKRHKDWIIFSTELQMAEGSAEELREVAGKIRKVRDEKYPPTMRCAGSIFKNLILDELPGRVRDAVPANVIREGKIPSAYFLEKVGAKGLRYGDIRVADYHANLIYNAGAGSARELRQAIGDLKSRVAGQFGLNLEEEVQYVGFELNGDRAV